MKRQTATERLDEKMRSYYLTTFEDLLSLDDCDVGELYEGLHPKWVLVAVQEEYRIGTNIFKLPAGELGDFERWLSRTGHSRYTDHLEGLTNGTYVEHTIINR
tara:strand:+ start:259 stop:567 length:309 start_codon:yes stop_codon:yes gene_type:complete